MTRSSPFAHSLDGRGDGTRSARTVPAAGEMPAARDTYLRTLVLPLPIIAVLCLAAAVFVLAGHAQAGTVRVTLAAVTGGVVLMLVVALVAARSASRRVAGQVTAARVLAQRGGAEARQVAELVLRGEQPGPLVPEPGPVHDGPVHDSGPFRLLTHDLEQSRHEATKAILRVAGKASVDRTDQQVQILVNLARRMQSLVHREIELLDELEAQVEDPDLLKGLFTVDHLATRMRRQSESLAVLGGSASKRQWSRQVTMHEVLRAAIAEVEHYSRVKVAPPVEGVLRGSAVSDVIHLIAELVENATKFSPPRTTTLLRAQRVSAGVAIEVEDRGLGIPVADQHRMNALLADPGLIDIDELLRDGRIGLYVVSALARRHAIRVQLQTNIYGGTQAVVVLPGTLLEAAEGHRSPQRGRVAVTSPMPAQPIAAPVQSATAERPPLPRRQAQVSLAPQLRDQRRDGSRRQAPDEPAEQMPNLMADFLGGVSRFEDDDFPATDARG